MPDRRTALQALAALTTAALTTLPGVAAAPSDKTVRFVLPNATGSGVDAITRSRAPAAWSACRPSRAPHRTATPWAWCPTTW